MLKLRAFLRINRVAHPAAFRRLCVETKPMARDRASVARQPPLGGCVLKQTTTATAPELTTQPPLGGCVLKQDSTNILQFLQRPAAFRRLCVETSTQQPWQRLY